MRVGRILSKAVQGVDPIDIELLLTKVLKINRANLKAYPERELATHELNEFNDLLQRRINGEPVAYLVGHKEFWSLDFLVTPDVLIPRADTELLVEVALELLDAQPNARILDLGTGCGAIALSIAHERPDITMIATDDSLEAIQIAQLNSKHYHISNVQFSLGNWYDAIANESNKIFDMIISNPPYIAQHDPHLSQGDLRFEPNKALIGGSDGMRDLHLIIARAPKFLRSGGQLIVEHGYDQEHSVAKEFANAGLRDITNYKDLSGIPRVTVGVV